eukprot:TRINITY_DN483_c0_g1_i6.p1 TRINITY_DN483_c0_g1~~TRINITY_DN483_c0_g1_i6.p1  ORF type:complete len:405 (-),score=48.74 TRINITY_DN483_c0_g1_i6:1179-2393(-)
MCIRDRLMDNKTVLDLPTIRRMDVYTLKNTLTDWKVTFDNQVRKPELLKLVTSHNEQRIKGNKSQRPQADSDYQAFKAKPVESTNPAVPFPDTPEGRKLYRRSVYNEKVDPRPPATEQTALSLFRYRRGDTTSIERDEELSVLEANKSSSQSGDKSSHKPGDFSSRAFEAKSFQSFRASFVGEMEAPLISLEIYNKFKNYPTGLSPALTTHFKNLKRVHPEISDLFISAPYSHFVTISKMPFPDPALRAAYTSFLGHLAAIFYIQSIGSTNKTISGVARSFYCTQAQLAEGHLDVQKRTFDDPISSYTDDSWWTSPEPCHHCYYNNLRQAFTHDTNSCNPFAGRGAGKANAHANRNGAGRGGDNKKRGGRGGGRGGDRGRGGRGGRGGRRTDPATIADDDEESE